MVDYIDYFPVKHVAPTIMMLGQGIQNNFENYFLKPLPELIPSWGALSWIMERDCRADSVKLMPKSP